MRIRINTHVIDVEVSAFGFQLLRLGLAGPISANLLVYQQIELHLPVKGPMREAFSGKGACFFAIYIKGNAAGSPFYPIGMPACDIFDGRLWVYCVR